MFPVLRYAAFGAACGCIAFTVGGCYHAVAHAVLHDEAVVFGPLLRAWLTLGAVAGLILGVVTWWADIFDTHEANGSCNSHTFNGHSHASATHEETQQTSLKPLTRFDSAAAPSLPSRRFSWPTGK